VISLDWTLILQFFNFFVLLFFLNKLLYRPLIAIIDERRDKIKSGHQRAQEIEAEVDEKMQRYQQQLTTAKIDAAQERAELRKAGHQQEAVITGEAQQKAVVRIKDIREQVGKEAVEAGQVLNNEAKTLAGQIAAKVLGRKLA
jgi:F-type H+-transporting ATPase subunit b